MFNRMPYNKGKFNIPYSTTADITGRGEIFVSSPTTKFLKYIYVEPTSTIFHLSSSLAIGQIQIYARDVTSDIILDLDPANGVIEKYASGSSGFSMNTEATGSQFGELKLFLKNINLAPNEELIIDMEKMTITVNGMNRIHTMSQDSDFFHFSEGNNTIVYSDNTASRNLLCNILWKDRWI